MLLLTFLIAFLTSQVGAYYNGKSRRQQRRNDGFIIENSFIVHLEDEEITPRAFTSKFYAHLHQRKLTHRDIHIEEINHLFPAVTVKGLTRQEIEELPHIKKIVPDSIKRVTTTTSLNNSDTNTTAIPTRMPTTFPINSPSASLLYGLDRLDQINLPLDNKYNFLYNGSNIDVYVVDGGMDTNHIEFKKRNGSTRIVKNIYDVFALNKVNPSNDNDDDGHGTHVAGTIGGNTVGVSPEVNLYGVKVLNGNGEGSTIGILTALDYIFKLYKSTYRRTVISMSLGGPCDDSDDCSTDTLIIALEILSSYGIIVSVAAGNEACNACYGSPNAAPSVVTVGASSRDDSIPSFSNFGQCIDIFAPGVNIRSACAKSTCKNEISYLELSGTSMACPHVSGVIAQILQKLDSEYIGNNGTIIPITSNIIKTELSCASSKNVLLLSRRDTISKNMLLHLPLQNKSDNRSLNILSPTCNYAMTCPNSCSVQGECLTKVGPLTVLTNGTIYTVNQCYCDKSYYGNTCNTMTPPPCGMNGSVPLLMYMYDSFGDGWSLTKFIISDDRGYIVNNAYDSLCYDSIGFRQYCLYPGVYEFQVSRGQYPNEVGWKICNLQGSAPSYALFVIEDHICTPTCPIESKLVTMSLYDSYGDGWNLAYYALRSESTGLQPYGGTLSNGKTVDHLFCLYPDCYLLVFEVKGRHPDEISYNICGYMNNSTDPLRICIMEDNKCLIQRYSSVTKSYTTVYKETVSSTIQDPAESTNTTTDRLDNTTTTTTTTTTTVASGMSTINIPHSTTSTTTSNGGSAKVSKQSTCDIDSTEVSFYLFDSDMNQWLDHEIILTPIKPSSLTYSTSILGSSSSSSGSSSSNSDSTNSGSYQFGTTYYYHLPTPNTTIFPQSIIIENSENNSTTTTMKQYDVVKDICLFDGCYSLSTISKSQDNILESDPYSTMYDDDDNVWDINDKSAWYACGFYGEIPSYSRQICIEKKYHLCYGLDGCIYIKSYASKEDHQSFFITQKISQLDQEREREREQGPDSLENMSDEIIILNDKVDGVHSLCDISDGEYHIYIGGGSYYSVTEERNTVWICGQFFPLPYIGTLSIMNNMTTCSTTPLLPSPKTTSRSCLIHKDMVTTINSYDNFEHTNHSANDTTIPIMMVKIGVHSRGWGLDAKYEIRSLSTSKLNGVLSPQHNHSRSMNNSEITDNTLDMRIETDMIPIVTSTSTTTTTTTTTTTGSHSNSDSNGDTADSIDVDMVYTSNILTLPVVKHLHKIYTRQSHPSTKTYSETAFMSNYLITHHMMRSLTSADIVYASGTLSYGEIGVDTFCLEINTCYSLYLYTPSSSQSSSSSTSTTTSHDDMLWMMCGYVGNSNKNILQFCVTENGCTFID